MAIKHEEAVLAIGQAIQASQAFSQFNPSIFTIRHFGAQDGVKGDIRDGERIAATIVIGTGVVIALLMEDMTPVWTSLLVAGISVGIYEWALATRRGAAPVKEETE